MKAKNQFLFLILLVLCLLAVLLYHTFQEHKWYLLLSELYLVLLGVYAFNVRKEIFKPLQLLQEGIDALKDGDYNVKFQPTQSPDMNRLVEVYNQMIDKIRDERVYQQEQHYFLDRLIEAMPVGVLILDFDHRLSEFNPRAQELFDLSEEDLGQELRHINHEIGPYLQSLPIGQSDVFKLEGVQYYRCSANRFMYKTFPRIFVLVDELSNEMLQAEKKAYGKVIRMMAHEVNNSIGAINSILNSILSHQPVQQELIEEYLPIVLERNEGLNQFMKNFAKVIRLPEPVLQPVNVVQVLRDCQQLIQVQYQDRDISFLKNLPVDELVVQADKSLLQQAFMNILKNSVEAIPQQGEITIAVEHNKRQLIISDTGSGIPEDVEQKLFTPFYSTKPAGQGVGLTLVKEILISHGFPFTLSSKDGVTDFVIDLP